MPFSVVMTDSVPDVHVTGAGSGGQFFPRFVYEDRSESHLKFVNDQSENAGVVDNIDLVALNRYRTKYGIDTTTDDVFYHL